MTVALHNFVIMNDSGWFEKAEQVGWHEVIIAAVVNRENEVAEPEDSSEWRLQIAQAAYANYEGRLPPIPR